MTSRWWPDFGYLRDHLATSPTQAVQRRGGAGAALFDRADLVLANEARTPLIVGGKGSGKEDTLARITVRGYYRQYAKLGGLCFGAWPSTLGVLEHRWGLEMVEVPATVATGQARPGRPRERDARVTELTPEVAYQVARTVLLRCIDQRWRQHLAARRTRPWPFSPTTRYFLEVAVEVT